MTDEQERIKSQNRAAFEELALQWRDPQSGETQNDLRTAVRKMICDYLEGESDAASPELYRGASNQYWAKRVCLLPEDIWNEIDERSLLERLPEGMPFKDTAAFLVATQQPPIHQRFIELERSMEEAFQFDFSEECACSLPFIGLLDDYCKATPIERGLINFVLRRLANTTLERLTPG